MVPPGKGKHEARGMCDSGHVVRHTVGPAMGCRAFSSLLRYVCEVWSTDKHGKEYMYMYMYVYHYMWCACMHMYSV